MSKPKARATILVPGITGTTLVDTYGPSFDTLWSGVQSRYETILDLALDEKGERDADPSSLVLPGPVETIAYGECVRHLRKKLRHPVYLFRYDWRLDNFENANRLDEFIKLVKRKCATSKVNLVTHSMGALIVLGWLGLRDNTISSVDRVMLTAAPLMGSPEGAVQLILGQQSLGLNFPTSYRKIARTFPSVYQLVGFYPKAFVDDATDQSLTPDQVWDEDRWQRRSAFRHPQQKKDAEKKRALRRARLETARSFHTTRIRDLDAYPKDVRDRFCVLYGIDEHTPDQIRVRASNSAGDVKNFFVFTSPDRAPKKGDGVVPAASTQRFQKIQSFPISKEIHWTWSPGTWDDATVLKTIGYHGAFLALDKNISMVRSFLQGYPIDPSYVAGIKE